jgi:putative ABC transport system permease protein
MFESLIKTAWRGIRRDKWYSLLNLVGLTSGIIASLLIFLFIQNELSYDRFHTKSDRIFRIISHISEKDDAFTWASTQLPLGRQLKSDYPEVEEFVRIQDVGQWMLESKTNKFYEEEIFLADSGYFDIFTHKFLIGDPETCLDEPNSIVLTESLARKYFGDLSAEVLELKDEEGDSYKVTAVIEDVPDETHFSFDALVSRSSLDNPERGSWGSFFLSTYILLKPHTIWEDFQSKLPKVIKEYVDPIFAQYGISVEYEIQPLPDIYLLSKTKGETGGGDMSYIYIFMAVGFFILLLASINYMNLATSRAERRSKEVGIRKVLGSYRGALIAQFISESILITLISFILAILIIAFILLTPFNQLSGKSFEVLDFFTLELIISYIVLVIGIGFLAGSYPALFLSSFDPVWVLKGGALQKVGGFSVRKVLVVFQFIISIGMVISTWVVYDQLNFLRETNLGFDKEKVLVINLAERSMADKIPILRDYWMENTGIHKVASASSSPGTGYSKNLMDVESKDGFVEKGVNLFFVDDNFIPAMGIEILEGRNFDEKLKSDSSSVIVNELLVARMDWDKAIGKRLKMGVGEEEPILRVIGVFRNFHVLSLYEEMEDLALFYHENNGMIHIRFDPGKIEENLRNLESGWKKVFPDKPFEYYFIDQEFFEAYQNDQTRSRVFLVFSILAIMIACMGLLGLASFTVEKRSKEIGIRKIVGASSFQIVKLVSKDFLFLVTLAMVIAFVLAAFMMKNWLDESFHYHTDLKLISFILSGIVTYILVFITVAFHSYKASVSNPVEILKDE